jgi:hypothetical protein
VLAFTAAVVDAFVEPEVPVATAAALLGLAPDVFSEVGGVTDGAINRVPDLLVEVLDAVAAVV